MYVSEPQKSQKDAVSLEELCNISLLAVCCTTLVGLQAISQKIFTNIRYDGQYAVLEWVDKYLLVIEHVQNCTSSVFSILFHKTGEEDFSFWPITGALIRRGCLSGGEALIRGFTIYHNCSSKQLFFNKHPECVCNLKKTETSVSSYNVNNRNMNLTHIIKLVWVASQNVVVGCISDLAHLIWYVWAFQFRWDKKVAVITRRPGGAVPL